MKRYLGLLAVAGSVVGIACLMVAGLGSRAAGLQVDPSDVVINEVEYDPPQTGSDSAWEWFELYNNTSLAISLTNWTVEDNTYSDPIPALLLPPGGFVVVAATDHFYENYPGFSGTIVFLGGPIGSGLANSGDRLFLKDAGGQVVDALSYGDDATVFDCSGFPCAGVDPGHSLEREPQGHDTDQPGDFIDQYPPTPGSGLPPPPPAADLIVDKRGPVYVLPGAVLTYTLALSNAGQLPAQAAWLTDLLPAGVAFVTHTASYPFEQPEPGTLVWDLGTVPTATAATPITFTILGQVDEGASGQLTNAITVTSITTEGNPADNHDAVVTIVGSGPLTPVVLVEALYYDAYEYGQVDEAFRVVNASAVTADIGGWGVTDQDSSPATFPPGTTLSPGEAVWCTREATAFERQFGFKADFEYGTDTDPAVPDMGGGTPRFSDDDECVLLDAGGQIVDVLVFGGGVPPGEGWSGDAVEPWTSGGSFSAKGQILYRKRDPSTRLPVADTDTAPDWAQDPGDPVGGRKVLYPGWDLDAFFFTRHVTETATLTVAVAPDNIFEPVASLLAGAQESIQIETYTFQSAELATMLLDRLSHGVSVTLLLEGAPSFTGVTEQGKWIARQLYDAGAEVLFMVNDEENDVYDRYDNQHAKFIVVDGRMALIGSENLNSTGMPADDKANGTAGRRGVCLITDAPGVVARVQAVFEADADPARHADVVDCGHRFGFCDPPAGFQPEWTPDWTTYTVQFPAPLVAQGIFAFEVVHSPENSLRPGDGLLGLLNRAGPGDTILVEQFYEFAFWGPPGGMPESDPNPRLEAYLDAARRGATVRILLDGHFDAGGDNAATVAYLLGVARAEGLDLQARLGDPTYLGMHNKMVLVWLDGRGYLHAGSINGSEASSKANREMALQVQCDAAYGYLEAVFDYDWRDATPATYLPLIFQGYQAPGPADHLLVSEVYYATVPEKEWVEIYNPTSGAVDLSAYKIGDAVHPDDAEGMYRFPAGASIAPYQVLVVAVSATGFRQDFPGRSPDFEIVDTDPTVPDLRDYAAWGTWDWGLANEGDEVLLLNRDDLAVDVVVYGDGAYPGVVPHPGGIGYGHSLEREPIWLDTDDCGVDFRDWPYPSPGELP